ncbi:MAG: MFS transporter [Gaiellales bacterium]
MRKVTVLVSLMVTVDLALWAAILPLLPTYADDFGLSKPEAALLLSAYSFGVILLAVPVGHLADRIGTRDVAIAGQLIMGAATVVVAFEPSYGALLAGRFAQGLASAFTWSAGRGGLAESTPVERRGRTIGIANSAATMGMIAGPLIGGLGASLAGIDTTFLVAAAVVTSLGVVAMFLPRGSELVERERSFLPAVRAVSRERLIGLALLVVTLVAMVGGTMQVLLSLRLGDHGYSQSEIGALFAGGAALGAVAIILSGRVGDRIGRPRVAFWDCLALATAVSFLSLPLAAGVVAGMVLVLGPLQSVLYGVGYPLGADGAELAGVGHGLVLGLVNLAWGLGSVVGPPVGGTLAEFVGDAPAYLTMAVACLATAVVIRRTVMGRVQQAAALSSASPAARSPSAR